MSVTKVHVCKLIGKGIYEIEDHINNPSVFHYSYKKKMHKDKDFFHLHRSLSKGRSTSPII